MKTTADANLTAFRRQLLRWYSRHQRTLPWRATPANPYHVMVSEAMLQQTQVATVIDYFNRFTQAFPTLSDLATADLQQVLTLWQGLGYYRRARHLHEAARTIVRDHDGTVPADVDQLLALPGVGRYTAGAIASIAYGKPVPILDGNVARVLCRVDAIKEDPQTPAVQKQLWARAAELVPQRKAGDFNQAMMELGALICLPRQPKCAVCPVRKQCAARAQGLTDALPVARKRAAPKSVHWHVVAVRDGKRFLFEHRSSGLWRNMWQLLTLEDASAKSAAGDLRAWLKQTHGLSTRGLQKMGQFRHATTHRAMSFTWWQATLAGKAATPRGGKPVRHGPRDGSKHPRDTSSFCWRSLEELADLPMPNPQRQIIRAIAQESAPA